jgi:hypothetical protein
VRTIASELEVELAEAVSLVTTAAERKKLDGLQTPAIVDKEVSRAIQCTKAAEEVRKEKKRSSNLCHGCPVTYSIRSLYSISAPDFKVNCSVAILNRIFPAQIKVTSSEILLQFPHKFRRIPVEAIATVSFRTPQIGEFSTVTGNSYLIIARKRNNMLNKLPKSVLNKPTVEWVCNFDYLTWLNRTSGRSFNDYNCYPAFPAISANAKLFENSLVSLNPSRAFVQPTPMALVTNSHDELMRAVVVAPEFYCCPEMIKGDLPNWASTPMEFVYRMRQMLESSYASVLLGVWVSLLWGPNPPKNVSHRQLFTINFQAKQGREEYPAECIHLQLRQQLLSVGFVTGNWIGVVTYSGIAIEYTINAGALSIGSKVAWDAPRTVCEWHSSNKQLFVYNNETNEFTEINGHFSRKIVIEQNLVTWFGQDLIHSSDGIDILLAGTLLRRSTSKIMSMACQWTFRLLVYAAIDGKVHFLRLPKGRELVCLDVQELIDSILITDKWGFVLLLSARKMFLCNVNGLRLKEVALESAIVKWAAFSSLYGFDYVVFVNGTHMVGTFEAFYPENMTELERIPDILAVGFDPEQSRLVIVTMRGQINLIPYTFAEPPGPDSNAGHHGRATVP